MKDEKNTKSKQKLGIFARIKSIKNIEVIIAVCLGVVVIFVMFGSLNFKTGSKADDEFSAFEYVNDLERKLSKILSDVSGAGKVRVMLSVESGMETVTAMETVVTQTADKTVTITSPVIVGGKTVVLKEMYPKITGVLIVASGADSIKVRLELLKATSSVLSIDEKIVEIYTMK